MHLTDVLWKATVKRRAEPGHVHENDGIPLDLGEWGISYWSAACDPLGRIDREGISSEWSMCLLEDLKKEQPSARS